MLHRCLSILAAVLLELPRHEVERTRGRGGDDEADRAVGIARWGFGRGCRRARREADRKAGETIGHCHRPFYGV